ncbi:hypothetical protein L1889_18385 [Paenalcaligenes niemegkensis]|uniref:hypothetical protein n=1 Tax=Paenalcaligenes niemegkensis TaxID=2895469 RepID=UPI001EE8119F|nr:hypothetical protein [Paenalcaligenes niemegkensis]MCQ9618409.1 hypothetical protein [Paenalcaligenes niemegkensis]
MPAGLQTFNADGTIQDDITTRFARILHTQAIPQFYAQSPDTDPNQVYPSGSFNVPGLRGWNPFYFFTGGSLPAYFTPRVTISDNTVSWSFSEISNYYERMFLFEWKNNYGGINLHVGVY